MVATVKSDVEDWRPQENFPEDMHSQGQLEGFEDGQLLLLLMLLSRFSRVRLCATP